MKKSDNIHNSNANELIVTTSWDDGQEIDLKLAEMLKKYDLRGTFYLTKYYQNPLKRDDIIQLDHDHEIGAHTLNHFDLTSIPISKANEEIFGSKEYLEEIINHNINIFSYPYGRYNSNVKKMVKSAKFIGARSCYHGNIRKIDDPYEWKITLHASNGSPRTSLNIYMANQLSFLSLIDWEKRAEELFDIALTRGGVYHIWGHGSEIEANRDWDKLERVLGYISHRKNVKYLNNSATLEFLYENRF